MAVDFKLQVGLDIQASKTTIKADIDTLSTQLQKYPLKLTAGIQFKISDIRDKLNEAVRNSKGGLNITAGVKFTGIQTALNKSVGELKQIPVVKVKADIDKSSINNVMNKIAKELKLDFTPQKGTGSSSTKKLAKDINEAEKQAKILHKEFEKVSATANQKFGSMSEKLRKLGASESYAAQQLAALASQFEGVHHLANKDIWNENETKQVQDFLRAFKQVSSAVKSESTKAGAEFFNAAQTSKVQSALDKVRETVAQYPKILSDPKFKNWFNDINKIDVSKMDLSKTNVEKVVQDLKSFISQAKQADLATKTLSQRFAMIARNATIGRVVTALLTQIKRLARQAYENVKLLDSAMVELRKVTNETESTYSQFFEGAKKQAAEVGAKLSDVISSTADFARLGYDIAEAADLAKAAQIYYNVGDGFNSITEASESVISTMKAFGIETKDVMTIVDAFNTTGNNFAISTSGIGEAMKRSASALAAAGNDMYESIALITAANTVVQDPESVGTALKTKVCLDVQKCAS